MPTSYTSGGHGSAMPSGGLADHTPGYQPLGVAMGVAMHTRLESYVPIPGCAYPEVPIDTITRYYVGGYEVLVYGYKGVVCGYRVPICMLLL